MIVAEVERTRTQSGWSVDRTLSALGIARATYYRQRGEVGRKETGVPRAVSVHAVTAEERAAVIAFKRLHPELRHRALAWTMVDEDVAYVSPSTVYRILSEAGMIEYWNRSKRGTGQLPARPGKPNQLWQTDLRYVKVAGRTYYLLVTIDVCSRFVPYHELLRWMDGETVSLAALSALETVAEDVRRGITIQSDNGSAFVSHDFARVLRENGVGHVRIHPNTPEQNGFVERVIRTIGEPLCEDELDSFTQAEQALDEIIDWYNHRRLHSAIDYLTPASVHDGSAGRILAERREKLAAARHRRRQENLKIRQRELPLPTTWEIPSPEPTANQPVSHFV